MAANYPYFNASGGTDHFIWTTGGSWVVAKGWMRLKEILGANMATRRDAIPHVGTAACLRTAPLGLTQPWLLRGFPQREINL